MEGLLLNQFMAYLRNTGKFMREISLHLMDIIQNSIEAKASLITMLINESTKEDLFEVIIEDNGIGMNEEMLKYVTDPFVTSRKTRRVGLGLSLFEAACIRCKGYLKVLSEEGRGTEVKAVMRRNHIDRAPLGRIEDTILSTLLTPKIDIIYIHSIDDRCFNFDSREIKKAAGDKFNKPEILMWVREYIKENIEQIGGGA
jgi:hypothetical protein